MGRLSRISGYAHSTVRFLRAARRLELCVLNFRKCAAGASLWWPLTRAGPWLRTSGVTSLARLAFSAVASHKLCARHSSLRVNSDYLRRAIRTAALS